MIRAEDTLLSIVSENKLLAAIVGAQISEQGRVATALKELRLESAAHLGRLDLEERYEMMAAMRGAGVALGDRNKLRLLASQQSSARAVLSDYEHEQDFRRTQAEESNIDRQADVRPDSATTQLQARERASEQAGGAEQGSNRILGVSGDSAASICLMFRPSVYPPPHPTRLPPSPASSLSAVEAAAKQRWGVLWVLWFILYCRYCTLADGMRWIFLSRSHRAAAYCAPRHRRLYHSKQERR